MLVPVEDAREIILAHIPVMGVEEVWLNDALGRVLAQEVVAPPAFASLGQFQRGWLCRAS